MRAMHWVRTMFDRRRFESEMNEEIRFHLEARTTELVEQGLPPGEAARQARVEFGGTESHKDGMRSARGLRGVDELAGDLRYAWRLLRKSPAFTAIAVGSLALAIGANTTIFSVANQMLYERLGVPHARELRMLMPEGQQPTIIHNSWGSNWSTDGGGMRYNMLSYPAYRELKLQQHALQELFAYKDLYALNATANGTARSASAQLVSGNFYTALAVKPQLGRPILPVDDRVGAPTVAVISDGFWHRVFDGSPAVVGRALRVNGTSVTIVGVNPPGFTGAADVVSSPELFMPISSIDLFQEQWAKESFLTNTRLLGG